MLLKKNLVEDLPPWGLLVVMREASPSLQKGDGFF